jgi:hypothetical protein
MYENAKEQIEAICKLVDECPEPYRAKAFEILLRGYVENLHAPRTSPAPPGPGALAAPRQADSAWTTGVPQEVQPRLAAMAQRRKVPPEKLAGLFDFSSDPFTFAPVHVVGKSTKDRMRNVALLVGARAFLATGRWVADWAEIKAMCTHQNCYDLPNFAATLKKEKGETLKSINPGSNVELSARGTDQAEQLLASLAGVTDAPEQ